MQVKVVWACFKISRACQDNFTRNNAQREKKGWESHIFDWKGLKFFCGTLTESENKTKWRERVASFRLPQQCP